MIFKSQFSETTAGSSFPLVLRRLGLIVVLAIVLTGCSSDGIKCWPFCGKSSSGVVASITVTYPSGGESLGGGTYQVTWTKSSSVGLVRIDLYNNKGTLERWLGDKLTETQIDWEIQEPNGLYRIRVTSSSDSAVFDQSDYFQIQSL